MEKNRNEMSPRELVERIQADLEALEQNAALFGRGAELDIIEALNRINFVSGVIETEMLLAKENN